MKTKAIVFIFILSMFFHNQASAKIRLLTFHFNRPDFIELQYKTFKKFLRDDFELIVFNDANRPDHEKAIKEMCEKYGIRCIRYQQEWHQTDPLNNLIFQWVIDPTIYLHIGINKIIPSDFSNLTSLKETAILGISNQPSIRHCHVIQYALDNFGYDHNDIVAIVDGDLFAIRPFSLRSLLTNCHIVGIQRLFSTENVDYLWVVFTAFDPRTLPNKRELKFHVDVIDNKVHDTGAHTYHFLKNNPHVCVKKYLGHSSTSFYHLSKPEIQRHGFNKQEIALTKNLPWPQCIEFHLEHRLLHFGASAFGLEGHEIKAQYVKNFIKKILGEKLDQNFED